MNDACTHIESLLPGFVEDGLGADDTLRVRAHLESCETCRASLVAFQTLEDSLLMRRAELPPVERFLPAFAAAPAPAYRRPVLMRAFRAVISVPGISILLAVWAGTLAFNFREPIGRALSFSTPNNLVGGIDRLADQMVFLTDGNVWLLLAALTMVSLFVAASMGAMTLRFVRH
ncbi:MAG: zf-HC2 domain-containing protein [Candidatus Krumholzibacteria bacterium]|nr:zf-HC2 domain-containing protein [Candidatus Krumholzibacteria bacterium]MDH5628203.1 zf-HC2 domain-containing protein [Candidatus Krumholzibacteria bacterium]